MPPTPLLIGGVAKAAGSAGSALTPLSGLLSGIADFGNLFRPGPASTASSSGGVISERPPNIFGFGGKTTLMSAAPQHAVYADSPEFTPLTGTLAGQAPGNLLNYSGISPLPIASPNFGGGSVMGSPVSTAPMMMAPVGGANQTPFALPTGGQGMSPMVSGGESDFMPYVPGQPLRGGVSQNVVAQPPQQAPWQQQLMQYGGQAMDAAGRFFDAVTGMQPAYAAPPPPPSGQQITSAGQPQPIQAVAARLTPGMVAPPPVDQPELLKRVAQEAAKRTDAVRQATEAPSALATEEIATNLAKQTFHSIASFDAALNQGLRDLEEVNKKIDQVIDSAANIVISGPGRGQNGQVEYRPIQLFDYRKELHSEIANLNYMASQLARGVGVEERTRELVPSFVAPTQGILAAMDRLVGGPPNPEVANRYARERAIDEQIAKLQGVKSLIGEFRAQAMELDTIKENADKQKALARAQAFDNLMKQFDAKFKLVTGINEGLKGYMQLQLDQAKVIADQKLAEARDNIAEASASAQVANVQLGMKKLEREIESQKSQQAITLAGKIIEGYVQGTKGGRPQKPEEVLANIQKIIQSVSVGAEAGGK